MFKEICPLVTVVKLVGVKCMLIVQCFGGNVFSLKCNVQSVLKRCRSPVNSCCSDGLTSRLTVSDLLCSEIQMNALSDLQPEFWNVLHCTVDISIMLPPHPQYCEYVCIFQHVLLLFHAFFFPLIPPFIASKHGCTMNVLLALRFCSITAIYYEE